MAKLVANVDKAHKELNWKAVKTLSEICIDGYNFIKKHAEESK